MARSSTIFGNQVLPQFGGNAIAAQQRGEQHNQDQQVGEQNLQVAQLKQKFAENGLADAASKALFLTAAGGLKLTDPAQRTQFFQTRAPALLKRGVPQEAVQELLTADENLLSQLKDVGVAMGFGVQQGATTKQRDLDDILKRLPQDQHQAAIEYAAGLRGRPGESRQERLANDPILSALVAQSEANIAATTDRARADVDLETDPVIAAATARAKGKVEAELKRQAQEVVQSNKLDDARVLYDNLRNSDLSAIYGRGESLYPSLLRSQGGIDLMAQRDRLISMLKLGARGELKGQGPITEGEQKLVGDAVTVLGNPDISPDLAISALDEAFAVILRSAGGTEQNRRSTDAPQFNEGDTATNPQTGQTLTFRNGQWQ